MRVPLATILVFICALAAPAQDITQPTLITLKLENTPPDQAFAALATQSKVEFSTPPRFWPPSANPITLDVTNQPFWPTLKTLCEKTNTSLKYEPHSPTPRILLSRDNPAWTQYPSLATGPFLVSLIGLQRTSTVDMRKPNDVHRSFIARFSVFCEPRVRLLRGSLHARITDAADDKGNVLVPMRETTHKDSQAADDPMNFVTSWAYTLEAKLEYPKTPGAKIPSLKGSVNFIAQTKSETLELPIEDPAAFKDVTRPLAGRTITVRELRRADSNDTWEAVVTFARDNLPRDQWERALFPGHTLRLVDAQNQSTTARGFGLPTKADQSTYIFKFEKSKTARPTKLIWEIPTETKDLPLTFEFKDVTLP